MVDLFQEDIVVEFIDAQNITADLFQILVVDGSFNRAVAAFFLSASAGPEFLIVSVLCAVFMHVADTAVGAFDLAGKTACVQTLVGKRTQFLRRSISSCTYFHVS